MAVPGAVTVAPMRRHPLLSAFTLLAVSIASASGAASAAAAPRVVAGGLDNPRGIDIDPVGLIYVAEAGRGGSGPCFGGEDGRQCLGQTGAITIIAGRHRQRIVRNLPSVAGEDGGGASGPQDVDARLLGFGSFITGLGGSPADRASLGPAGAGLGRIFRFTPRRTSQIADLVEYEKDHDPDSAQPGSEGLDSNPTSLREHNGAYAAVDAGGNDLLRVRSNGRASTLAVFPSRFVDAPPFLGLPPGTQIPAQAVPTAVAKGPDGALYVSQLTGFPFPVGGASIYRVVPGSAPTVYASGLTNVTDLAFDRAGGLYVVQIARNGLLSGDPTGEVIKIARNGTRTSIASDGLVEPYGIAIGRRGEIYVTNKSSQAGVGEVLRLR